MSEMVNYIDATLSTLHITSYVSAKPVELAALARVITFVTSQQWFAFGRARGAMQCYTLKLNGNVSSVSSVMPILCNAHVYCMI